jgi:D-glucosaminate-6-phosphate ammonia-lyase
MTKRLINVSGTMTSLGASRAGPEVIAAVSDILGRFVAIDELQAQASAVIARATGAEAGYVTSSSASGMTLAIAAAMTGADLARIELLPGSEGLKDEVVIQSGHLINYGAPVAQAIRIPGAKVVAAGTAAHVETYHIENAITERTAAALFVVSHHVVQEGQTGLAEFIAIAKSRAVPVIVDMASEYDLEGPFKHGADVAIWSAHKFLGGPTAGIVAGKKNLIGAAYLQNRGIGRHMKAGKEAVAGAVAALEAWMTRDHAAAKEREQAIVAAWQGALASVKGLSKEVHHDWTGNPIDRLKVTVTGDTGLHAWELADRLAARDPSVRVRDDLIEHGYFFLDPCNVSAVEAREVSAAIADEVAKAQKTRDGFKISYAERRRRMIESTLRWPD